MNDIDNLIATCESLMIDTTATEGVGILSVGPFVTVLAAMLASSSIKNFKGKRRLINAGTGFDPKQIKNAKIVKVDNDLYNAFKNTIKKVEPLIKKFESIGDPRKFYNDDVDDMGRHIGKFPVSEKEIQLAMKKYSMVNSELSKVLNISQRQGKDGVYEDIEQDDPVRQDVINTLTSIMDICNIAEPYSYEYEGYLQKDIASEYNKMTSTLDKILAVYASSIKIQVKGKSK